MSEVWQHRLASPGQFADFGKVTMMSTVYALLVGIDSYAAPVPPLRGCEADVDAIHDLLVNRIPDGQLDIHRLVNEQAKRQNVIDEFRSHLGGAGAGDVAIFWYSGHGSQHPTASAPGVEPDGLDETLVLVDSRADGGTDLADKELAALIAEIAKDGVHVFVGLDCCHSGSGTREILPDDALVRRAPTDRRVRSRDSYLSAPDHQGRHVLLAACRSEQTAKELRIGGVQRGALSAAVERALRDADESTSYRQLHRAVRAAVGQSTVDQVPQLEVTNDDDALGGVFNGMLGSNPPGYLVAFDGTEWLLDAGAVHGIPPSRGEETTTLQVRDPRSALDVATAKVVEVRPESSVLTLSSPIDTDRTYQATVTALPLPKLPVTVDGELPEIRSAIDGSPYLRVDSVADLTVRDTDGGVSVVDAKRGAEPVTLLAAEPDLVVASLEQISRWRQIVALDNAGSELSGVVFEVRAINGSVLAGDEIVLRYDGPQAQKFTVSVRNSGTGTVYCAVLALSESYAVTATVLPGGVVKLEPGEVVTSVEISAVVPDLLWEKGVTRRTDVLKLIVAETEFDPGVLAQRGLPQPVLASRTREEREVLPDSTLARLLRRVQERELEFDPGPEAVNDWTASSVRVISERLQPGLSVGPRVELGPGVSLEAPPGLSATASLTASDVVSRDVFDPLVPPMMVDDPTPWAPLGLVATRDTAALDVLELRDVAGQDSVTPSQPMILRLEQAIPEDESILAIAFDGQNYLVVGSMLRDGEPGTSIRIDTLPTAITTRSLTGSIRLLFRRFLHKFTGQPSFETRLAVATFDAEAHEVRYEDNPDVVAREVAQAGRILLLMHGILGDTEGMVAGSVDGFGDGYDLLLTFDYENINTPVSDTAGELLRKLGAASAGQKPGQQLDVIAHSMGGLVARWLIEQDRPERLVSRLITAGTPNGGSPWPVIQDWATTALTFGLNQLAQAFWPAHVLSGLVTLVEKVDKALDDMAPGSKRLATLFESSDPHLPYTVLVGDRSLIAAAAPTGRVKAILEALKRRSVDMATALAFVGEPNDLAVAVASAKHLPPGRTPAPEIREVACDHITFFSSDAGRAALAMALER
jgi:pimeloyl-ACP methyl ester carboxylesterase